MHLLTSKQHRSFGNQNHIPDMIVFSHLRWEFVKQRPQHLIERFSKHNRVLFVEEPIAFSDEDYGSANIIDINENLMVIQPRIEWGNFQALHKVVSTYSHLNTKHPVVWLYSASFLPIIEYMKPSLLVYDCMDELSAFKGAPKELVNFEKDLLAQADVVFTGGKSLYESKRRYNKNTYCFPSSVDKAHFRKAFHAQTQIPEDVANLTNPIVGFYGVIDERIDLTLLARIASLNPHIEFVMIGPVVKISESDLPTASNIHYLGGKSYDELPQYLKSFKMAMMPFALNESTKFISPTKTLEFMAAYKPIISTPIYDVKRDYKREVRLVESAQEFTKAINYYLHESPAQRRERKRLQKEVIERVSWDATAESMQKIMAESITRSHPYEVSLETVVSPRFNLRVQMV